MSTTANQIVAAESSTPEPRPSFVPAVDRVERLDTPLARTADATVEVSLDSGVPGTRPIHSAVVYEPQPDGTVIASDLSGAVYGTGPADDEAYDDLMQSLDEHLRFLRSHEDELHPRLVRQLARLHRLFPDR